ncbi:MAG: hypothetical protein SPH68_06865, partial [Candidatus Borkfalkiaceae bacterium]|nr:hypothetical protein [Clostridia bacterium]MDY6223860.1 hypothetical protein [Christensenellaceae bacterium]
MKKNKRLLLIILSMAVCGCTAAACGGEKEETTPEPEEENVLTGKHVMNGLNNTGDMYRIRIIGVENDCKGLFSVSNQQEYIKGGEGSLHIEIEQSRAYPEFQFRPQDTDIPQMDVSDLKNFSAWVYNANEDVSKITMNILHNDGTNLLSQEFELAAGAWTECVMPVNAVVTKYLKEEIYGFSLGLQQTGTMEFYIDEISAEFGKVFSEDDNAVMTEIDSLTGAIDNLSDSVSADDEEELLQLYGRYNALPELYRAAIYNYDKITGKMSDLLNAQSRNDGMAAGASYDRPAFYFDKFYGIAHFSNAETSNNFFGYSSEKKREGEDGTCYIQYNNEQWNYTNLRGNVLTSDYDYIEMWLFNEGEKDKAVFFGWNNRVNVPAGEWKQVILPTSCFKSTGIQIIVTSLGPTGADLTDGRLYLSKMSVHKLASDKMYEEALDTEKLTYAGSNATLTAENGAVTVNVTADGNIDLTLCKNDEHETLNVAQSFVFSVYSPKIARIQLLNGEGEEISAGNSVQVAPGRNTFVLSSKQYNETSTLRIGGLAGEEYAFRYGYAVRSTDMQAMRLLIERDDFGTAQDVTINELPQVLEYLNIYN